ncbi:MAG: 5-(carboxyamino)imidazole ribonucleotide mutase [Alphaproteobacteria bacterium]|nr:5-(carboxyamino)imidazole ribonucleotide mutase [Emcibacter sp.]NOZ66869.1 5-(carboxyamino)imidazole ribonucleotide mutase [Alphaproteobacteria bacterium]
MAENETLVGIIMGSQSDWGTMKEAAKILDELGISNEAKIISAHRTPQRLHDYVDAADAKGMKIIIAGAGAAAHLAGVTAALTTLPVLGVPMESPALKGMDSLLSTVQMPGGIPVATLAIGKAGAKNAGLFATAIIALSDKDVSERLIAWRKKQAAAIPLDPVD